MKIVFFETQDNLKTIAEKNILKKNNKLIFEQKTLNRITLKLASDADIISASIYSKINKAALDKMPRLKLIATRSTGFDHIDLEECKKRNITVCNVPKYGESTIAEHAFGLILALSKNIHKAYENSKKHDFSTGSLMGIDLKDKTIGIVGTGNIGAHIASIAKGFSMSILAYDLKQNKNLSRRFNVEYVDSVNEILKKSDIITLHLPLLESTRHLINMKNVNKIKKGALLINTSRGGLVDTDALIYGLNNNIIAGAGLDVLEGEELLKNEKKVIKDKLDIDNFKLLVRNHLLLRNENVIYTPHIAYYTKEAVQRIMQTTIDNINGFVKNKIINKIQ